jgi:hypothetical protein
MVTVLVLLGCTGQIIDNHGLACDACDAFLNFEGACFVFQVNLKTPKETSILAGLTSSTVLRQHPCICIPLLTHNPKEGRKNERKEKYKSPLSLHYSTSIPPHSNTRNNARSDARTASTPTTFVQNVALSSAVVRAAAAAQTPTSSERTPRKSMKTRVTTSGAGETRICAAFSYDACETKRRATYSCLSRLGSQYLRGHPRAYSPAPENI